MAVHLWQKHFNTSWECSEELPQQQKGGTRNVTLREISTFPPLVISHQCRDGSPPRGGGLHHETVPKYHSVNQLWYLWRLVFSMLFGPIDRSPPGGGGICKGGTLQGGRKASLLLVTVYVTEADDAPRGTMGGQCHNRWCGMSDMCRPIHWHNCTMAVHYNEQQHPVLALDKGGTCERNTRVGTSDAEALAALTVARVVKAAQEPAEPSGLEGRAAGGVRFEATAVKRMRHAEVCTAKRRMPRRRRLVLGPAGRRGYR